MTPWEIQGTELMNCNCSYGCPCQFNALPTHGHCAAMGAIEIDSGHYGDVVLDGVRIAVVFEWPGPSTRGGAGASRSSTSAPARPSARRC